MCLIPNKYTSIPDTMAPSLKKTTKGGNANPSVKKTAAGRKGNNADGKKPHGNAETKTGPDYSMSAALNAPPPGSERTQQQQQ